MLKSELDKNTSVNEEASFVNDAILSQNLWIDSKYIPQDIATVSFVENYYSVYENQTELKIIQKCNNIELLKVEGTRATFKSASIPLVGLIPASYGSNYTVQLLDATGEIIPVGYNDWVIDSGNGLLIFNKGIPSEFTAPFYLSYYRYVGRTGTNLISTSGGDLDADYIPENDTSIATKGYIDALYHGINEAVGNLTPEKPATFDQQDLEATANHYFVAKYIKSNQDYNCIIEGDDIIITTDYFCNESHGYIKVYIGSTDIGIQIPMSKTIPIGPYNTFVEVLDNKDAYEGFMTNFYFLLKLRITIPYSKYKNYFTESSPFISIRLGYEDQYYSNFVTLGIERIPEDASFTLAQLFLPDTSYYTYVSGVPTLVEGSKVLFEGISSNLSRFYLDKFITVKVNEFFIKDLLPNKAAYDLPAVYNGGEVDYRVGVEIPIPANICTDFLVIDTTAYDILGNELYTITNNFHIHIDTYPHQSRKASGNGQVPDDIALSNFTESLSLVNTNELQQLGSNIVYPQIDYSRNGIRQSENPTGEEPYFHDYVLTNSIQGPDYSGLVTEPSYRYITYKYNLEDYVNAFIINITTTNINHNTETHVMENCSLQCKMEEIGWLDCNSPYDGVSIPEENNDSCLVVYRSSDTQKYITFGSTPRKGTLYLRFGMKNILGIVNSISIEPIPIND